MEKVLAIAPYAYLPYFSGGQKFIAHFYEYLAEKVELTVISVPSNDHNLVKNYRLIPMLKASFSRYYDRSLVKKIISVVNEKDIDTLIFEHPYYAWLAFRVRKRTGARVIIHTHNIEFQRFQSMGKWWWPVLKAYEKRAFKKADHILFITPEDKKFAVESWQIEEAKCIDLPFGIDIPNSPADRRECRQLILERHGMDPACRIFFFNGLLNYKPNLDALHVILEKLNPILMKEMKQPYKILICGKGLPEELDSLMPYRDQHIVYAGYTDRINFYYKASDLLLNPVQTGGGIKTKMVESIANGTTVISTESGAKGIDKDVCGRKLIIVKDNNWSDFAKAVMNHSENDSITPETFYKKYYWVNVIENFLRCLGN